MAPGTVERYETSLKHTADFIRSWKMFEVLEITEAEMERIAADPNLKHLIGAEDGRSA